MITYPYGDLSRLASDHQTADISGSRTHYWVYGPDDAEHTLVLLHGFRGDHHGLEAIAARLPEYRLIAPDLPGFGESTPFMSGDHNVATYAGWLTAFIAKVVPGGSAVPVGHSFGSVIVSAALANGLAAPHAVLINPIATSALSGPRGILSKVAVGFYQVGARLPERLGTALLGSRLIVRALSMLMTKTRDRALRRWIHDQHHRYFSAYTDRRVVLEAFTASVSHHVAEFAANIDIPVLLIGADQDDITSVAAQEALAALLPDAHLVMITGVGHLIHYETPDQAAAAIREALGLSFGG